MEALAIIPKEQAGMEVAEQVRQYVERAVADNTRRAYRADLHHFASWCEQHGVTALPASPETVAAYIASLADVGYKTSTIARRLAAISTIHQAHGYDSPTQHPAVRTVLRGVRKTLGVSQEKKAPILPEFLRKMVASIPNTITGKRDRALLLVGFAAGLRRSELVALDVEDVEFTAEGMVLTIRRSKTDQEAQGERIPVAFGRSQDTCPVRALRAWLDASNITTGAIFRHVDRHGNIRERLTDQSVALVVKKYAEASGMDPVRFAGHSLRAGFATTAARNGAEERDIARVTRHKSERILRGYIREGRLFRNTAVYALGL